MNVSLPFGELLQALRKQRKLSQQALADKLGVHRNTLSAWEHGEWLPGTRGIVVELGKVLGLDSNEATKLMEAALFQSNARRAMLNYEDALAIMGVVRSYGVHATIGGDGQSVNIEVGSGLIVSIGTLPQWEDFVTLVDKMYSVKHDLAMIAMNKSNEVP